MSKKGKYINAVEVKLHMEEFFGDDMSAERLPFDFNSLIPETYKSKAEAFAKCLQHKLLSLGKIDSPSELPSESPSQMPSESSSKSGRKLIRGGQPEGERLNEVCESSETCRKKTDDSEEEPHSYSESENGNSEWRKRQPKLTSMSSEDSTVGSWSSCQENLTDLEKADSEAEEVSSLAAQIKGSPKLKSFNIRAKRKELREKTWQKNPRCNHSSSTESVDSDRLRQEHGMQADDLEFGSQFILLDGLEPEDDVPHRILRESSSTSSLERHFSCRENDRNSFQFEKKIESNLLTPPPSPDTSKSKRRANLNSQIHFAQIETDSAAKFVEAECISPPSVEELSRPFKKVAGVIIECMNDEKQVEYDTDCPGQSLLVTCVEVLQDNPPGSSPACEQSTGIELAEDDEILNSRSRMRRCSSLKTWKTPPGTPGAKKIVRFADALGLDLADVRTFLDEIPKIPSSAYEDLQFEFPKCELPPPLPLPSTLLPSFRQPGREVDFLERVQNQKICLESTVVSLEGVPTVTGFVRVQNIGFHKSVHVRYTLNNWVSYSDLQATYVPNSCDGFSDRFSFSLYGHTLKIGEKLEFALRMECCGTQYWDNNSGTNYVFHCLPQTSAGELFTSFPPASSQPDPWFHFY